MTEEHSKILKSIINNGGGCLGIGCHECPLTTDKNSIFDCAKLSGTEECMDMPSDVWYKFRKDIIISNVLKFGILTEEDLFNLLL